MDNVYWLGGSPCVGKTTLSNRLAQRLGWRVYHEDEHDKDHAARATSERHPVLYRLSRLHGDDLWLRPVEEQICTEVEYSRQNFDLVLEDVTRLADESDQPLLVEGCSPHPNLIAPLLPNKSHAFWLIPTEAFQVHHYAQRPWVKLVLDTTSNPDRAWANWMARDAAFAHWLAGELQQHVMPWRWIDGSLTLDETEDMLAAHYARR
jgi:hypothetical protein